MRKLAFTVAAGALALTGASVTAEAGAARGADALRSALADAQLVEKVHCVPGRWHHRSGDGCRRTTTRYYYSTPYYSYGYGAPYYGYGYSPYYGYGYGYSPGIGFSFRIR